MMKMNQFKRILGLFVFILMISCIPVYAVDEETINYCESNNIILKYNITMSPREGGGYYIKSNPSTMKGKENVVFKITKVNGDATIPLNVTEFNKTLKAGSTIIVPSDSKYFTEDGYMEVTLETTNDSECPGTVEISVGIEEFGSEVKSGEIEIGTTIIPETITTEAIDCTKTYTAGSFEAEFCEAKNNAKGQYNFAGKFNNGTKFSGKAEFKCDAFNSIGKCLDNDTYYINKSYMYGSGEKADGEKGVKYVYHYAPGKTDEISVNSCKLKCEEAVTVEYGPPIASKAGLCFEYKVKVTSRVSCNAISTPEPPKTKIKYCTPKPVCTNAKHSYYYTQGGPNDDFDDCIKDCDGGKYTDKCTDKCYKKVYGTSSSSTRLTANQLKFTSYNEENVKNEKNACIETAKVFGNGVSDTTNAYDNGIYKGCYYYDKSGNIYWAGKIVQYNTNNRAAKNAGRGSLKIEHAPGRWYSEASHKYLATYTPNANGIFMNNYSDSRQCSDTCWWSRSTCSEDSYLNPNLDNNGNPTENDQAYKDYKANLEKYQTAVKSCKAAATCTTSTAEFTISVKYDYNDKTGKNIEQTINFPYTSNGNKKTSDKLNTPGLGKCSDSATETASKSSIMLSYDGCYKCKDANRWYQAEWSFPGTWINNKTAEISYIDKTGTLGWRSEKGKFCMPLNAKDVNTTWWNYYQKNNVSCDGSAKNRIQSTTSDDYKNECESKGSSTSITKVQQSDVKVDKYNINATARKFGYYEWNIDISCFYGLNSNPASVSKENTKCTTSDYKPRVRSVDLTNLFPAADGSKLTTPDTVGRTPGFNWSEYATNYKNQGYLSNPSSYITSVQTKGYTVYSDNYLDYEFTLSPSELNKLKNQSKNMTYGEFADGESEIRQNGVIAYRSTMLRNLGNSKVPDDSVLGCNNISNYKANKCDTEDANNAVVKED